MVESKACSSCGSFNAEDDDNENLCLGCRHAVDVHGALVSSAYGSVCDCAGIEGEIEEWNELDFSVQEALKEWFNVSNLDNNDRKLLAKLHTEHRFVFGECGECGESYYRGHPESWNDFQGVSQDEGSGELCQECFAHHMKLKTLADFE